MSWLQDYLDYTETQESPTDFHLWCGVSTIAAVMNRKVWLPRVSRDGIERYRVYPGQLSIILVAGSGKCKKSTAIDIAQKFMLATNVRLFDGKITPERLLRKLSSTPDGRAVLALIASELSVFLSRAQYNEHMVDILTKLLDSRDDSYETQAYSAKLKDVCVTLLCGTTPHSMGKSIPAQAQETGFMSRFICVYADKSGKIEPLMTVNPRLGDIERSRALEARLLDGLRQIDGLAGPVELTQDAREWFVNWYQDYMTSDASSGEGWPTRRPDHLLRLGTCLQVSDNFSIQVNPNALAVADKMLQRVEMNMPLALAYVGRHANNDGLDKIFDFMKKKGNTATGTEIYRIGMKYFSDAKAIALALHGMKMAGVLASRIDSTNTEHWDLVKEPY